MEEKEREGGKISCGRPNEEMGNYEWEGEIAFEDEGGTKEMNGCFSTG